MSDALEWERTALEKRPWRTEVFVKMAKEIADMPSANRVLELGSGPAYLAARLLCDLPQLRITLPDFSPAMHELARRRVGQWQIGLGF